MLPCGNHAGTRATLPPRQRAFEASSPAVRERISSFIRNLPYLRAQSIDRVLSTPDSALLLGPCPNFESHADPAATSRRRSRTVQKWRLHHVGQPVARRDPRLLVQAGLERAGAGSPSTGWGVASEVSRSFGASSCAVTRPHSPAARCWDDKCCALHTDFQASNKIFKLSKVVLRTFPSC